MNPSYSLSRDTYLLISEIEGFIVSIQCKVIKIKNYQRNIIKIITSDKCRICYMLGETIEHVITGCCVLADNDYLNILNRYNSVAKIIHSKIANKYKLLDILL